MAAAASGMSSKPTIESSLGTATEPHSRRDQSSARIGAATIALGVRRARASGERLLGARDAVCYVQTYPAGGDPTRLGIS